MIRLMEVLGTEIENDTKKNRVVLYADTKAEVTNSITGSDIDGMSDDALISANSFVLTASFEVGQFDSSGHWHWR